MRSFEWDRVTLSVHELIYGESSQFENDGGRHRMPPPAPRAGPERPTFYQNEIGVTPITNLEVTFSARRA